MRIHPVVSLGLRCLALVLPGCHDAGDSSQGPASFGSVDTGAPSVTTADADTGAGTSHGGADGAGTDAESSGPGAATSGDDDGTPSTGGADALPVHECDTPDPDWVFCTDFEEGNKDAWDDYDGNPDATNLLVEDPGPFANAGNHAMQFIVPPGRGGSDLTKLLPGEDDRLYARWYIQWEPGFDLSAPNHGGGLHAGSRDWLGHSDTRPLGDDWYSAWIDYDTELHASNVYAYYAGMYMDCVDPQGACWGDHFPCMIDEGEAYCTNPAHRETVAPPVLETGRWYCIELMLDGGTPSAGPDGGGGSIDFWVDGLQIGPWTELWLRVGPELRPNILWLNLFHHGEHSVAGIRYDHVVVSRSPIGCGG